MAQTTEKINPKTDRQRREDAAAFGLAAFENGFNILELKQKGAAKNGLLPHKACLAKNWPAMAIDEDAVRSYTSLTRGIRMGRQHSGHVLAAGDADFDCPDTQDAIEDTLTGALGEPFMQSCLIRSGAGSKTCYFFRLSEEVPPFAVPKYLRGDANGQFELFASPQRQCGAFGVHSTYEDRPTEPAIEYGWFGPTPADTPVGELPLLTKEQLLALIPAIDAAVTALGWERMAHFGEYGEAAGAAYDLPDAVAAQAKGMKHGERMPMAPITGEGTNPNRGIIYHLSGDVTGVLDSETWLMHLPASAAPKDIVDLTTRLADKLSAAMGQEEFDDAVAVTSPETVTLDENAPVLEQAALIRSNPYVLAAVCDNSHIWNRVFDRLDNCPEQHADVLAAMGRMVQGRYVVRNGAPRANETIIDLLARIDNGEDATFSPAGFTAEMQKYARNVIDPETGEKKYKTDVNLGRGYRDSEYATRVVGYKFDPRTEDKIIERSNGTWMVNRYLPPAYRIGHSLADVTDDDPDLQLARRVFLGWVEHLVPNELDRHLLLSWMACKVQRPSERGVAMLMVTPVQGTGRGVLSNIFSHVIGHATEREAGVLLHLNDQGRFHDYKENRLLLTCKEVHVPGADANFSLRERAFEKIKELVEPGDEKAEISRKGLGAVNTDLYYSVLLSTNHEDALPIPASDRRVQVIGCTDTPVDEKPEIAALLDDILVSKGAGGAQEDAAVQQALLRGVWKLLGTMELSQADWDAFHSVRKADMTAARKRMIELNEGPVERVMKEYLEDRLEPQQDIFNFDHLVHFAKQALHERPKARDDFAGVAEKVLRRGFEGWRIEGKQYKLSDAQGRSIGKTSRKAVTLIDGIANDPVQRAIWYNGSSQNNKQSRATAAAGRLRVMAGGKDRRAG